MPDLPFSFASVIKFFGGTTERAKKLAIWAHRLDELDKKLSAFIDKQGQFNAEVTKDIVDLRIKLAHLEERIGNVRAEASGVAELSATKAVLPIATELAALSERVRRIQDRA